MFIGRPVLWGLAHSGEEGVHRVLELLNAELVLAMKLAGTVALKVRGMCMCSCVVVVYILTEDTFWRFS